MGLLNRIEELEKELLELKELVKEEQDFPQKGDMYWLIEETTGVCRYAWDGDDFDNKLLSVGNVFRTKDQAEFAVEKLKVEAELRKLGRHFEKGNSNTEFYYDHEFGGITFTSLTTSQAQGTIYFESEEKAQQAIESVGEKRIKKYIFGVED